MTLYPGGADQVQDTEEVSRTGRSATEQPAYRHLSTIKLDSMPLADFGNRIPNITAVIAFASVPTSPAIVMTEPPGLNPPGALSGADTSYMFYDPLRNRLVSLKDSTGGIFYANASGLDYQGTVSHETETKPGYGLDGFIYTQIEGGNRVPLLRIDIETDEIVSQVGTTSTVGITDDLAGFGNAGEWHVLTSTLSGIGQETVAVHLNTSFPAGGPPNGSIVSVNKVDDSMTIVHTLSTADGLVDGGTALQGTFIGDPDRSRFFIFQSDTSGNMYHLVKYEIDYGLGLTGAEFQGVTSSLVKSFTRGTFGTDDFGGTGNVAGWALNRRNGDLMLANGTSMLLYNPDTDQILATKDIGHLRGRNNYYTGGMFAFGQSVATAGTIYVIDTRSLATIKTLDLQDMGYTGIEPGVFHEESMVWDDRVGAVMFSRVDAGSTAITDERITKLFVNKVIGLGVGLDTVASALCTEYNGVKMAGLAPADFDVTTLAGDTVQGYTLNNKTTLKGAFQPLRDRFQFDIVQSDWKVKFPKRGGAPVLTIPEEFVGEFKRGRTERDSAPVVELRVQDTELPVKVNIRYKNKDADYDVDMEHDKRQRFPTPTMSSGNEVTLDIPLVDTPSGMRPIAQNWLWTMWNERRQFKTVVPWTYMELDPSDVFNMGVFGETVRMRMADEDIGLSFAMDITGVAEDTYTYASTIVAGFGKGRPENVIPSNLPTTPILMDAPLLDIADINISNRSNAYAAAGVIDSSWRGATFLRSPDDTDYASIGATSFEATTAKVKVAPPALVFENGNPVNRILEITDGGTMTITPQRQEGNWLSATELAMLNGANSFMMIYPSGVVQMAQYVDATANTDGTITLDRLLLGRLGTEDIAATAPPLSTQCVLLTNNVGATSVSDIMKLNIQFADLQLPFFYKAATIGTLEEDAFATIFTYTGRDLKPYTVTGIQAICDGTGGIGVSWLRRTRGPRQGEWLNFIESPPLNETIEQYEVTLSTPGAVDFITKIVNDLNTVSFTLAELTLGGATELLAKQPWPNRIGSGDTIDGTFEIAAAETPFADGGWVNTTGVNTWSYTAGTNGLTAGPVPGSETRVSPASVEYLIYAGTGASPVERHINNTIDLVSDLGLASDQIANATVLMNVWVSQGIDSGGGSPHGAIVTLQGMDSAEAVVDSTTTGYFETDLDDSGVVDGSWVSVGSIYDATNDPWPQRPVSLCLADGISKVSAQLTEFKGGTTGTTGRVGFDHLELQVVGLPADMTVKVSQVSASGLKSPIASRQVS